MMLPSHPIRTTHGARPTRHAPRAARLPLVALAACAVLPSPAAAQVELCTEAERFVRQEIGMQALSEPDTIDDWRTRAVVPGCRVTAAGATAATARETARGFFRTLAESEWERTPDPRDAPNEASLRYRRLGADCLFTWYDHTTTVNTDAEFAVADAVDLAPGERLHFVLVMCVPAAPAAPRGEGGGPPQPPSARR